MALVKCRNCSAQVSTTAETCPNCGQKTKPVKLRPCRACSALLDPSVHAPSLLATGVSNGTTTAHYYTHHVPCPKCGERKPLAMTITQKLFAFLIGPLTLLWLFWEVRAPHGFGTFTFPTDSGLLVIFCIENAFLYWVALLITSLVGWFLESVFGFEIP